MKTNINLDHFPSERTQNILTQAAYDATKSDNELLQESLNEGECMVDLWYDLSPLAQDFYDHCRDHHLKWIFHETMLEVSEKPIINIQLMEGTDLPF